MKQQRLDGLADGIFAIVMTLLLLELRIPDGGADMGDAYIWHQLVLLWPFFLSLVISFALLFTYWRAHHFIASVYAKNLSVGLANINALFFFLIALVPFSASLLGTHPHSRVAIFVYGLNVITIGFTLYMMRQHIENNPDIETSVITKADRRSGYIRILFPVFASVLAILVSGWSTTFSVVLFGTAILFNLVPESSNIIHRWLDLLFSDDADLIQSNYKGSVSPLADEEYICVPKKMVFDHHRFQTVANRGGTLTQKRSKKKIEEKIEKNFEKEIEHEIKTGEAQEIVRTGVVESEE